MDRFPIPYVLECMHFVAASSKEQQRIIRDYEFDLYIGGERDIYLDGVYYHISEGSLVFRKPGQLIIGKGDYNMYLLTLDFSHRNSQKYYRDSATPQQPICNLDVLQNIPSVFTPYHQAELKVLYEKLFKCSHPNIENRSLQEKYITEFLFLVLADAYKFNRSQTEKSSSVNSYVRSACNYINDYYNTDLTVKDIAKQLSLNENYLIRLFKAELKTTPNQYILETRLLRAKHMLLQTTESIKSIAFACGFNTSSYFIKCFKLRFGHSPKEFRAVSVTGSDLNEKI